MRNRAELVAVAIRDAQAGLVIINGKLVNVWSDEIYPAGFAGYGNRITAIGNVDYCIRQCTKIVDSDVHYLPLI